MVENQVGEPLKVEYAADLNANKFGSGFGTQGQKVVHESQSNYCNHQWNLCNFQRQKNSILQFPSIKDMSGINVSWMYVGMKFATFCWHFEDLMLPSLSYLH